MQATEAFVAAQFASRDTGISALQASKADAALLASHARTPRSPPARPRSRAPSTQSSRSSPPCSFPEARAGLGGLHNLGAPSRKQRRSQPASGGSSLCCAGQRRRHAEHHGRLLLRRSGGRGPRGCAAGLLHLLTSGHSVGRLPNRNGAGHGDDQRHHGRAAGLLHRGAGRRAVGRLPYGERAGHADAGRHHGALLAYRTGPTRTCSQPTKSRWRTAQPPTRTRQRP